MVVGDGKDNSLGEDFLQGVLDSAVNNRVEMGKKFIEKPIETIIEMTCMMSPLAQIFTSNYAFYNNMIVGNPNQRAQYLGGITEQLVEFGIISGITKALSKTSSGTLTNNEGASKAC